MSVIIQVQTFESDVLIDFAEEIILLEVCLCYSNRYLQITTRNSHNMSVARVQPLKSLSISSWLAELHMECYKRNLENYDTIKVSSQISLN